jgi:hypothetical protein
MMVIFFPVAFVLTFFGLWEFLYFLGIESFPPIGYQDAFGFVLPPKWIVFPTILLTIGEYFIGELMIYMWEKKWKYMLFKKARPLVK